MTHAPETTPSPPRDRPEQVVVVGGGFGGLLLARELAQAGARGQPLKVTLIDQRNHHTFQPLLYQVATAGLQPPDIGISLRATLRRHPPKIRLGEVVDVDPDAHEDGSLTFVIAGGGPTGVELAGALAELVELVVSRDHPDPDTSRVRIVLVEVMDRLLGGFSSRSAEQARHELERRGVEVRLGTGIAQATEAHVTFDDDVLRARILVWAAGVAASPLAQALGVELGPGGRLPGLDRVVGAPPVDVDRVREAGRGAGQLGLELPVP